jgi:hypothetical protein
MNQNDESNLRISIRGMIRHVKQKKLNEETQLRDVIRDMAAYEVKNLIEEASVPDVNPTPNKSTGINVLEELLKKIIPVLETDYKSLTTDKAQRESFRSHIINACVNTLTPSKINTAAGDEDGSVVDDNIEEIDITVGGDEGDDKFIDIRTDAEISAEEPEEEEDPLDGFGQGVEGDETGRNVAYQCFKKIESSIIDAYELLSNEEDQELFYDYLIANLKLYFNKFEEELAPSVSEPTNQAYDMAQDSAEPAPDQEANPASLQEYINSL